MPDAIRLVRAGIVLPFINFLDQIGAPTERLLRQSNLSLTILNNPDALLPLYLCSAFVESAAQFEGASTLGILVAQKMPTQELHALGPILCNALTLFDLLVTIEQTVGMINSGQHLSLQWEKDSICLQHHCIGAANAAPRQSQYYTMALLLNALRLALGPTWMPTEMHIMGAVCHDLLAIDEFAAVKIQFQRPHNAIKIPRALLSLPLKQAEAMPDRASPADYEALIQCAPAHDFVGSLRQLIRAVLPQGDPDISLVANAAGMSVRSCQRKLAEQGLSYSVLVRQVRFDLAVDLLKRPEVKLVEIAAELGYTDAANFTRAFRRWTSLSPSEFRQLHQYEFGAV